MQTHIPNESRIKNDNRPIQNFSVDIQIKSQDCISIFKISSSNLLEEKAKQKGKDIYQQYKEKYSRHRTPETYVLIFRSNDTEILSSIPTISRIHVRFQPSVTKIKVVTEANNIQFQHPQIYIDSIHPDLPRFRIQLTLAVLNN